MCFGLFKSSIGKKMIVAVTGFILLGFVIAHLLGNLQIFLGPEWLNGYAEHLEGLPLLLWPARIFLLLALIVHIATSLSLAIENRKARPTPYVFKGTVQASIASRTMVISGLLIFLFIVYHLLHFTFGVTNPEFFHLLDPQGREDVYSMVVLSYQNYSISITYILAMIVLYLHLSHGAPNFLQSLGLTNERTLRRIGVIGNAVAWLILIGNCSIPIAIMAGLIQLPAKGA